MSKSENLIGFVLSLLMTYLIIQHPAMASSADEMASKCEWAQSAKLDNGTVFIPRNVEAFECWGFFNAVQGYSIFVDQKRRTLFGSCPPTNSTLIQYIKIFVSYVEKHPEKAHEKDVVVANWSLMDAFPCPNN